MKKNNKKGFTLAELLVVVGIIAILVAIAIPTFSAATNKAEYAVEQANARSAYAEGKIYYMTSGKGLTDFDQPVYDGVTYTVSSTDGENFTVTLSGNNKQIASATIDDHGNMNIIAKSASKG